MYNYSNFHVGEYDLGQFRGPVPGSKAPDFELDLPDGTRQRLMDFHGDFLVLEMGSITCPLFQGRRPAMARLDQRFPNVAFAVLYVREAHPGADIPAHDSFEAKRSCASRLVSEDGEGRRVLIDSLDGQAHSAYGGYPNSAFIINRNHCVLWATDWNDTQAVYRALDQLASGQAPTARAIFKPVPPNVSLRVLGAGGKGSLPDFLRGLPHLIWANLIRRNLRVLTGRAPRIDPHMSC